MKCIFWGMTDIYQQYKNTIDYEIVKGNIEPLAIVSREKLCKRLDNINIIDKSSIKDYSFDYLIIFAKAFNQIKKEALENGIPENKIINGNVFNIPFFDFKRYVSLIENPVTIISDNCWGGYIYNLLGLRITSPFVNFPIQKMDYLKMLSDFDFYINKPLELVKDGSLMENKCPKVKIKDTEIVFDLVHDTSYADFIDKWKRRKQRINYKNLLFKMIIENDEQAEIFDALPLKNKIGFYHKPSKYTSIVCLPYYLNRIFIKNLSIIGYRYDVFLQDKKVLLAEIDILKMLTDKKDFMRAK